MQKHVLFSFVIFHFCKLQLFKYRINIYPKKLLINYPLQFKWKGLFNTSWIKNDQMKVIYEVYNNKEYQNFEVMYMYWKSMCVVHRLLLSQSVRAFDSHAKKFGCSNPRCVRIWSDFETNDKIMRPWHLFRFRLNIIHTKLRHNLIQNYDLFRENIIKSPNCTCGLPFHFLYICTNYTLASNELLRCLLHSTQLPVINCHLLLWGDEIHNDDTNQHISSVQKFIRDSDRFAKI